MVIYFLLYGIWYSLFVHSSNECHITHTVCKLNSLVLICHDYVAFCMLCTFGCPLVVAKLTVRICHNFFYLISKPSERMYRYH